MIFFCTTIIYQTVDERPLKLNGVRIIATEGKIQIL